jgi:hypothetical protein
MGFSLAVRTLGALPVECNARALLFDAHAYLERGLIVEAGCRLREAVRRFLHAQCEYHGCLPKQTRKPAPRALAKALKKAGHLSADECEWILEIIELGNKASRLSHVRPRYLACGIEIMHSFLDASPYLVQPLTGGRV